MSRRYKCSKCGELGHNSATCGRVQLGIAPRVAPGNAAAQYLAEHGGNSREIAARFGVSRQAVMQAWRRLFPGRQLPSVVAHDARVMRIVELAAEEKTAKEIATATSCSYGFVLNACRREGVAVARSYDKRKEAIDAAVESVVRGEATTVLAAIAAGVSLGHFSRILKKKQVRSFPDKSVWTGQKSDRSQRASALVDEGYSINKAASTIGVAPGCVVSYRERRGLPIPGRRKRHARSAA